MGCSLSYLLYLWKTKAARFSGLFSCFTKPAASQRQNGAKAKKKKATKGGQFLRTGNGLHPHKGPFRDLIKQIEAGQILIERKNTRGNW
jgi:hypothetical protein